MVETNIEKDEKGTDISRIKSNNVVVENVEGGNDNDEGKLLKDTHYEGDERGKIYTHEELEVNNSDVNVIDIVHYSSEEEEKIETERILLREQEEEREIERERMKREEEERERIKREEEEERERRKREEEEEREKEIEREIKLRERIELDRQRIAREKEEERERFLHACTTQITKTVRGFLARKRVSKLKWKLTVSKLKGDILQW